VIVVDHREKWSQAWTMIGAAHPIARLFSSKPKPIEPGHSEIGRDRVECLEGF
jgi:hypothetical protein